MAYIIDLIEYGVKNILAHKKEEEQICTAALQVAIIMTREDWKSSKEYLFI